jgi:hypothetical protein
VGPFASFGVTSQLLQHLTASYGQREEFFMPGKGLSEGWAVIDDNVFPTEMGFCEMPAVAPAENHDLITVAMKLQGRFVNKGLIMHLSTP